jgi:signal transduction histidine kinase
MGILGHDLRNPLGVIVIGVHQLLRKSPPGSADARLLERVDSAAGRMTRMIAELLDVTRAQRGGGIPVVPVAADMQRIARQVCDELEATHPGRPLLCEAHGDTAGEWDPDRVAQVLTNLLANALEHSPPDRPVQLTVTGVSDEVVVEVKNRGKPIPTQLLPMLFEPFRRGTGGRSGGLGLGLYIVRELVTAHGGHIDVRSGEGGTVFVIRWPRRSPASRIAGQPGARPW